jgi:hypothetical protein
VQLRLRPARSANDGVLVVLNREVKGKLLLWGLPFSILEDQVDRRDVLFFEAAFWTCSQDLIF